MRPHAAAGAGIAADRRLRLYGIAAIVIALGLLVTLLTSIFVASWTAWTQTQIRIDVTLDPDRDRPRRTRSAAAIRTSSAMRSTSSFRRSRATPTSGRCAIC